MHQEDRVRELLLRLVSVLQRQGEEYFSILVKDALAGTSEELSEFLVSNSLWGGPGSIADQAGMAAGRSKDRRAIERILIVLGEEQIRAGQVNDRTEMWVETFKEWDRRGI